MQVFPEHSKRSAAIVESYASVAKFEVANTQTEKSFAPGTLASRHARRRQIAFAVLVHQYRQLRLIEHQLINRDFLAGQRENVNIYIDVRRMEERRCSRRFQPVQRQVIKFRAKLPDAKMKSAEINARAGAPFDLAHHDMTHPALHDPRFDQKQHDDAHRRYRENHEP